MELRDRHKTLIGGNKLNEIIKSFCKKYGFKFDENLVLKVVSDIADYIRNDDLEYYLHRECEIDNAFGMLYEDSNNRWIILIKEQDLVNFYSTIIHEYVHWCDYRSLSTFRNNSSLRELQNDYTFLFWTEFHATYMSYRVVIDMNPSGIEIETAQNEIVDNLRKFYSSSLKLDIKEAMDNTVRSYGSNLALYDTFPDKVKLYPNQYYYNKLFREIYDFMRNHKSFDAFIVAYSDFSKLLSQI